MLMLRNVLTIVWCRFGSWSLDIKSNFCPDFEHKVWSRFWSWCSAEILKLKFSQYFATEEGTLAKNIQPQFLAFCDSAMHILFSLEFWLSGALSAPLIVSHCVSELDLTDSIIHRNFEFMTLKYGKVLKKRNLWPNKKEKCKPTGVFI